MEEWKRQAKALFFIDHLEVTEIAIIVRKARETVSRFINSCEGYDDEMAFRKAKRVENRKEYQRKWDRSNRSGRYNKICPESMKREHLQAVFTLSKEGQYG